MIFRNPPRLPSKEGINLYVQSNLFLWMKNLSAGLNGRMNFDDNFVSFLAKDIEIAAGATAEIPNALSVVPTERMIARQTGNGVLTDGTWDINTVRIVNNGAVAVTASIRFFSV